jgi:hypothetical protein
MEFDMMLEKKMVDDKNYRGTELQHGITRWREGYERRRYKLPITK